MKAYSSDGVESALNIIHQNYYAELCKLDDKETKNIKIAAVGAWLDVGFNHTSELKVMKFKEAMKRPDNNKWKKKSKISTKEW